MYEDASLFPRLIDTLLRDEAIDVLAINLRANVPKPGGWAPSRQFTQITGAALRAGTDKLVVGFDSIAGGDLDQEVVRPLAEAGVPYLDGTETALAALRHAREHRRFLVRHRESVVQGPGGGPQEGVAHRPGDGPQAAAGNGPGETPHGRGVLGTAEAMRLLRDFGIPVADTLTAKDAGEAALAADCLGYPVVVKIDSPDIAHKTDVGGVHVGCPDAASVRRVAAEMLAEVRRRAPTARLEGVLVQRVIEGGTEMILGVKSDPLFGPAVVCGFGGVLVEVMRDVSVRVPPLDAGEAQAMIDELRGRPLLAGVRGRPPADVAALRDALVGLAALAEAHRGRLRALDINPLLVLPEGRGAVAVDWLIELA
jgi:acyl-CoA synthetase (NDP forming)